MFAKASPTQWYLSRDLKEMQKETIQVSEGREFQAERPAEAKAWEGGWLVFIQRGPIWPEQDRIGDGQGWGHRGASGPPLAQVSPPSPESSLAVGSLVTHFVIYAIEITQLRWIGTPVSFSPVSLPLHFLPSWMVSAIWHLTFWGSGRGNWPGKIFNRLWFVFSL